MGITLYLVRHGNTFEEGEICTHVGAGTDLRLTAFGRAQAERAGRYLAERKLTPEAVYAGSLLRQIETAEIISYQLGGAGQVQRGIEVLNEVSLGPWEGLTNEQICARWGEEYRNWEEAGIWPEGIFAGSLAERQALVGEFLAMLTATHRDGATVVAASSNAAIRLFQTAPGGSWERHSAAREMKKLKVATGSISELAVEAGKIAVRSWNLRPAD